MNLNYFFLIFIILLTISCRQGNTNTDTPQKCKYGAPRAIFLRETPGISNHSFSINQNEGIEKLRLDMGVDLTIIQSGCNNIRQEFQFLIPGKDFQGKEPAFWVAFATELLSTLGRLGPDYAGFSAYAQAIESIASEVKLAESFELQQSFYVSIDRVLGTDNATLVLTFSDQP